MPGYVQFLRGQLLQGVPVPQTSFPGQTIIVTGASSGLGLDACKHLLRLGAARIVMGVRNMEKGEKAKAEILSSTKSKTETKTQIEVWPVDLTSYSSILAFCDRAAELPRLDHAILNAGVHTEEYSAAEGLESTITVNVVSTFLMGLYLLPTLRQSAQKHDKGLTPHLTITGSAVHFWANTKSLTSIPKEVNILEWLSDQDRANMKERYYLSKLLVTLLARRMGKELDKSAAAGKPLVIVNNIGPGFCRTELFRDLDNPALGVMLRVIGRSSEEGSRTLVWGLLAGKESQGVYMSEGVVKPMSDFAKSKDGDMLGEKLWKEVLGVAEQVRPGAGNLI